MYGVPTASCADQDPEAGAHMEKMAFESEARESARRQKPRVPGYRTGVELGWRAPLHTASSG